MTRHHLIAAFSALALITAAGLLTAGPINPPVGPIASTAKPLSEVEPRTAINAANTPGDATSLFKITQPGSYYLTGNITGVAGKHGIAIASSGVTLDLNGFDLIGVPAMGAFDGASVTIAGLTNLAVVNGSIRNWGGDGVDLGTLQADNSRMSGIVASGNTGTGIVGGQGCTVTNCSSGLNNGAGISTGSGSSVNDCSTSGNGSGAGIAVGAGSTVTRCSVSNCGAGINAGLSCTIVSCAAQANDGNGILVGLGSLVADCSVRTSTLDGIRCVSGCFIRNNNCSSNGTGDGADIHATGNDSRIEGNTCTLATRGIQVDGPGNIILRNSCSGNTLNWVIVANNVCGPILDRTAPASAAISGNSAPSSLGSTDSNANFSY
jgi:hypothetical protein